MANQQPARMPAASLGHGSPMNALERNRYTETWRSFGASAPRPRGILVVSAHWYGNFTAVTAMSRPRTIHDFYGFPQQLFAVRYPAPGDPHLAEEVADVARPTHVGLDVDGWGIDHGAWSVLVHAFPKADVPVLQLSVNAGWPPEQHLDLGIRLAPLRERGVLILCSGNVVHNLRAIDWDKPDGAYDWALRFDEAARAVLVERPAEAPALTGHEDHALAAPTPDHFLPALYLAGLATAVGERANVLISGCSLGSISMTSYGLVARCPRATTGGTPAAGLPAPSVLPPEGTNP